MATYQLIDNIERADVIPSVWCLCKFGKHIRNIYLSKLLVEINLHFVLSISKHGIHSIVVSRVDITENCLLQLLCSARHAWVIHQVSLGVDAGKMLIHCYTIAVVATFLPQFGFIYHAEARDDRTGIENLLKLLSDDSVVKFVGTFLKLITCLFVVLACYRSSHIAVCLAIPVEGIVQTLVVTILRTYIVNHAVDIAVLQSQLLSTFIIRIHYKLYLHIRVVAQEGALLDGEPHGETACLVLLLIAECCNISVEDFLQLLCLGIVVNHLALNELSHLHFFFTIESVGFRSALLALFTTDDVVVAKELYYLFYLVLDIQARSLHIVDKE